MAGIVPVQKTSVDFRTRDGSKFRVIREVDFSMGQGALFSLIGRSGCGKSTLLNIVGGLQKATEGEVLVDAQKMTNPNRWHWHGGVQVCNVE